MSFYNDACYSGANEAGYLAGRATMAKRKFIFPLIMVAPLVLFSSGCANMPKETSLSIGGAVAGAAVGARAGGLGGAIVGAAIGGYVGNLIGSHLDEEDKKKLAEVEQKALDSGKPSSFVTNKTKATLTVTPDLPKVETVRTYKVASDIESYQLSIVTPKDTNAFVDTPVYGQLGESSAPKMIIKKGEVISIQAYVESNDKWGAIVNGDTVIGYVPLKYLDSKIVKLVKDEKAKKPSVKTAKKTTKDVIAEKPSEVSSPSGAKKNDPLQVADTKDKVGGQASTSNDAPRVVQAMGTCKTITRTVDTGNKSDPVIEKVKYCQEPPPKWKTIAS